MIIVNFNNYTFSKSSIKIDDDEIIFNTLIITSKELFQDLVNDADLNLILLKNTIVSNIYKSFRLFYKR